MARYKKGKFNPSHTFLVSPTEIFDRWESLLGWWRFDQDADSKLSTKNLSNATKGFDVSYSDSSTAPLKTTAVPMGKKWIQDSSVNFNGTSDLGIISSTNKLSLGDGVSDKPFSISFWIKPVLEIGSGALKNYVILQKGRSALSTLEWSIYVTDAATTDGNAAINFDIYSGGTDVQYIKGWTAGLINRIRYDLYPDKWYNVTCTYDGSGNHTGIKIYVNSKANTSRVTAAYAGSSPLGGDIGVGSNPVGGNYYNGDLSTIVMWSKELSSDEVLTLFKVGARGSYNPMSGYLNNSSRVVIRERDNATGSYPTNRRTLGIECAMGNGPSTYDDTRFITFNGNQTSVYPLVTSEQDFSSSGKKYLLASPNRMSTILAPGTASNVLSSQGTEKSVNYDMGFTPFDESLIALADRANDSFFVSGTNEKVYPGFGSPLRDKFIIRIKLPNHVEKTVSRYSTTGIPLDPFGSLTAGSSSFNTTGFYYYNPNRNRWDDVGFFDPIGGGDLKHRMWYGNTSTDVGPDTLLPSMALDSSTMGSTGVDQRGTFQKPQQFKMSTHLGVMVSGSYDELSSYLAYDKIGSPTISGMAPYHRIYHASASHTFKMSDYISHPFVLEKVILELPVTAQRMRGPSFSTAVTTPPKRFYDSCRDIDNYTFFLYRQSKSGGSFERDSNEDILTSRRMIICSGSAAFYNLRAFNSTITGSIQEKGLPHGPSFSHNWDAAVLHASNESPPPLINAFTGTIYVKMIPAVGNQQFLGATRFPILETGQSVIEKGARSVLMQDFWPGGTTAPTASHSIYSGFSDVKDSGRAYNTLDMKIPGKVNTFAGLFTNRCVSPTNAEIKDWYNDLSASFRDFISYDQRPLRSFCGLGSNKKIFPQYCDWRKMGHGDALQNVQITFGDKPSSIQSPYVLLPQDEIILGLDAGISMIPSSGSDGAYRTATDPDLGGVYGFHSASAAPEEYFGTMSGSIMRIQTSEASIILFGSLIRDDRELMYETNQNLTSEAIHESIGSDRITDEFMISSRMEMSASYVDDYIVAPQAAKLTNRSRRLSAAGAWVEQPRVFIGGSFQSPRGARMQFSKYSTSSTTEPDGTQGSTVKPGYDPIPNSPRIDDFFHPPADKPLDMASGPQTNKYYDPMYARAWNAKEVASSYIRSLQRFVGFVDTAERDYDSIMPHLIDLARRSKGVEYAKPSRKLVAARGHPSIGISGTYGLGGTVQINWPYVGDPQRMIDQKYATTITASHAADTTGNWTYRGSSFLNMPLNKTKEEQEWVYRNIFHRGTVYWGVDMYKYDYAAATLTTQSISDVRSLNGGAHQHRFGISNYKPSYSRATYRCDRYGQFRDMMEQRRDTKQILFGANSATVGDSPIQVKFVYSLDGSTIVNPFDTDSVNFSTEYTASIPYIDQDSTGSKSGILFSKATILEFKVDASSVPVFTM